MLRKLGLAAFLLGVVVPASWLVIEHLRGRAQLAEELGRLKLQNVTLDIEKLIPPPPPAASNGMPAFSSAVSGLDQAIQLLPPVIITVAPARAVPPGLLEHWPAPENTNSWKIVDAWVQSHADDYEALHQALALPGRWPVFDYSQGLSKLKFPHLAPMKSASTALSLSAAVAAHRGDFARAHEDLAAMRVLETDFSREPILISQLVRIALATLAQDRAWAVSHSRDWTESQLAQLQAVLPTSDFATDMVRSLQTECAACYAEIQRHPVGELANLWLGTGDDFGNGGGNGEFTLPTTASEVANLADTLGRNFVEGLRRRVLIPLWGFGWKDQALAHYLRCADRLIEAHAAAAKVPSLAVAEEFNLDALLRPSSTYARLHTILAELTLPPITKSLQRALRTQTEGHLLTTDLAIRRYRLRHGQLPKDLSALVPDFLSAIPVDGMDGQPLRYRLNDGGDYVLWSIGENLKDDGGDASWPKDEYRLSQLSWRKAQDVVLPQPATPDQIAAWQTAQQKKPSKPSPFQMSPELLKRYGLKP